MVVLVIFGNLVSTTVHAGICQIFHHELVSHNVLAEGVCHAVCTNGLLTHSAEALVTHKLCHMTCRLGCTNTAMARVQYAWMLQV